MRPTAKQWELWTVSDATGQWERYTRQPFATRDAALRWATRYIPDAKTKVVSA